MRCGAPCRRVRSSRRPPVAPPAGPPPWPRLSAAAVGAVFFLFLEVLSACTLELLCMPLSDVLLLICLVACLLRSDV